ncbi:hypothetical protein LUZ61_016947 [Rhynchospora tenuis]|uniref:Uncharacterized protein n=1 Tax=Rhynchospora tenuis TaxID=198213 RepID=A0AAD6EKL2_9POAL|nr:hypothetical protein LUZ61_016947 [Rhynchospora tenuis]
MEEAQVFDEMLAVVDSCIARVGWRLRPHSKRHLSNDILALCTGLRSVTLVDYDGRMPELQNNLSKLLYYARQEAVILKPLRVMVISDMAYLIHVRGLAELAFSALQLPNLLHLLDTETDPPKLFPSDVEGNQLVTELVQVQKMFSEVFPAGVDIDLLPIVPSEENEKSEPSENNAFGSLCVDMTGFIQNVEISIPTLNGWLLGYPVTYLFSNEKLKNATSTISMQPLHIYKIYATRNKVRGAKCEHELMSFSVPSSVSMRGEKEPWAEEFLARMRQKVELSGMVWRSVRMEVEAITEPRSIVF